jgi:hypothetical protein
MQYQNLALLVLTQIAAPKYLKFIPSTLVYDDKRSCIRKKKIKDQVKKYR